MQILATGAATPADWIDCYSLVLENGLAFRMVTGVADSDATPGANAEVWATFFYE
jgi:hypothetical protein